LVENFSILGQANFLEPAKLPKDVAEAILEADYQ